MEKLDRIFLYFFVMVLSIGCITNPQVKELISLSKGVSVILFFVTGVILLFSRIYKSSVDKSHLNRSMEIIISLLLLIVVIGLFSYLYIN